MICVFDGQNGIVAARGIGVVWDDLDIYSWTFRCWKGWFCILVYNQVLMLVITNICIGCFCIFIQVYIFVLVFLNFELKCTLK